jgi:hypothetical protein
MRTPTCAIASGIVAAVLFAAGPRAIGAADPQPGTDAAKPVPKYVGVKACASCHKSKATGNQVEAWKATAHALAFLTLGTEAAREVAKKAGLAGDPRTSPQCVACHTTAAGVPRVRIQDDFDASQGVQCEACHGPGSEYSKIQHMIKHETALELGLVIPDVKTCKRCHNAESPTFKGFDYASALKKIRHPLAPL